MNTTFYPITQSCHFHLGECPDAWQAWYDDSHWDSVTLPHDWSVSLPFSREYSSGTGYLAGGVGWYRIRITPKKEWEGKNITLAFDGVYKNSRVWCNSYYLGERPNGYISFSYDITRQFSFEHDNIICVRVDHRDIADSRWFTGSGITRKVQLIVQEPIHTVWDGLAFDTPEVSADKALFHASCELKNTTAKDAYVQVTTRLLPDLSKDSEACSSSGISPVAAVSKKLTIPADSVKTVQVSGQVLAPQFWAPEHPDLYTLEILISTPDCEEYLTASRKVGIRSIRFDANEGFFLNETPTLIKGVCIHHDAGCMGAAVLPAVWKRRLLKLKAMGCNAIRMSHNPHMPELYDLCDSIGFLAMDEAFDEWEGPKNKWSTGHNVYPPKHQGYYTNFPQWHERDLTDLIRRDRCHPSIIMWSIGNEIDYPNDPYCHPSFQTMTGNNDANKPEQERQYNPLRPDAGRLAVLAADLTQIVKKTDISRPVTLAAAFPELSSTLGFLDALDVAGYNYKEHLYEESHRRFPDKPFIGSENSHSLEAWKAVTDNAYISGQFLWTGIDYLGEAHGWPVHGSGAGLLTLAGFEKPGYYRRQSFWSDTPMVHLATARADSDCGEWTPVFHSWNYIPGEEILVKCYTNLPSAEFFLNGESLGIYEKKSHEDCIHFTLPFTPGKLTAKGITQSDLEVTHTLVTTGTACRISLSCFQEENQSHKSCPETNTFPTLYQIEALMQDSQGNTVFSDTSMLHVSVENGTLLGLENGDLADVTDYTASYRRACQGKLLIYVRPDTCRKPVTVTVSGENLRTTLLHIPNSASSVSEKR